MNIDPFIIYHIFSYLEPSRNYLDFFRNTHPAYTTYKLDIDKNERSYTNKVICHVCKPVFYMDIIDDDYQDYEDLKDYLRFITNIPHLQYHNTTTNAIQIYNLEQYFAIFKDLIYYLVSDSIDTIPIKYKCNTSIKGKTRFYKKIKIYSYTVYALLLRD